MVTPLRTSLYRRAGWAVICLVAALAAVPVLRAQYGKKNNQSKGPRALGILELYPSGQARLRPICIMIDGRFYDAGIYKADPVPMALETGNVYEAERAGESQGLFTIKNVLQNETSKTFAAEGTWRPAGSEPPKSTAMKAETKPKEAEDDKPPVLRRPGSEPANNKPSESKPSDNKPADNKPAETNSAEQKPSSTPSSDDDSDRPVLRKPQTASAPGADTPAQSPTADNQPGAAASPDEDDPSRPHLRRGGAEPAHASSKPAPASKPPNAVTPAEKTAKHPATSSPIAPNQTQFLPAVSDADGPEPRPYTYEMTPKEEQAFTTKVLALATQDLFKKAKQLEPESVARATTRAARTGKASSKPAAVQPIWDDVQLKVFDIATNNEPILVLNATAHLPQRGKPANAEAAPTIEFFVTEVAHSDLYGQLRSLFSAVTDERTLDVTPKYQLIDIVDADGDGRGELLFRQTSDQGMSFVIYRVGADKLWPLYEGTPGQ